MWHPQLVQHPGDHEIHHLLAAELHPGLHHDGEDAAEGGRKDGAGGAGARAVMPGAIPGSGKTAWSSMNVPPG